MKKSYVLVESVVKARAMIAKGVVLYDSNTGRLFKNASRIQCVAKPKTTTHIRHFLGDSSLESYIGCGVYVLNSFDPKFEKALDYLLNLYLDSGETLNLVFLGEGFNENEISDAMELGVKVRFRCVPLRQAYIDEKQPINLENVVASML